MAVSYNDQSMRSPKSGLRGGWAKGVGAGSDFRRTSMDEWLLRLVSVRGLYAGRRACWCRYWPCGSRSGVGRGRDWRDDYEASVAITLEATLGFSSERVVIR